MFRIVFRPTAFVAAGFSLRRPQTRRAENGDGAWPFCVVEARSILPLFALGRSAGASPASGALDKGEKLEHQGKLVWRGRRRTAAFIGRRRATAFVGRSRPLAAAFRRRTIADSGIGLHKMFAHMRPRFGGTCQL